MEIHALTYLQVDILIYIYTVCMYIYILGGSQNGG